ncbi:hypothetical protein EDD15DRAFT_2380117 [Pisolithus albus]|nr:hypothetical protein EDD15DRAFT_2380117 [Pisolithus albus]
MNSDMEEEFISAIPVLALVILSMKGNKIQCFPLIEECTFSQPCQKVFIKVTMLIAACPEVLLVVIVLINESPHYQSPSEKSLAWRMFASHQDSLGLTDFMSLCDVNSGDADVDEDFMVPLVVAGHTWCHISSVDYYVWLKCTPNTGPEGSSPVSMIRVDPDTAVKQSDWSVHGELPRNKNLDNFDRLLNKGLEMIQLDIMQFCQEITIHHNLPADYSGLEKSICIPPSWDHFHSALVNMREITTHACFMHWYKDSFRGMALPEGPDTVQCPEILGPCKHHPPYHFAPAEDDPDPPLAPTRNPAPVVSPTSMGELEFIDIDGALKGNADEGDDDDNKYNDTEHPNFTKEAPQRPIPWA